MTTVYIVIGCVSALFAFAVGALVYRFGKKGK